MTLNTYPADCTSIAPEQSNEHHIALLRVYCRRSARPADRSSRRELKSRSTKSSNKNPLRTANKMAPSKTPYALRLGRDPICPLDTNLLSPNAQKFSSCGHAFCDTCMESFQREGKLCPVCATHRLYPDGFPFYPMEDGSEKQAPVEERSYLEQPSRVADWVEDSYMQVDKVAGLPARMLERIAKSSAQMSTGESSQSIRGEDRGTSGRVAIKQAQKPSPSLQQLLREQNKRRFATPNNFKTVSILSSLRNNAVTSADTGADTGVSPEYKKGGKGSEDKGKA